MKDILIVEDGKQEQARLLKLAKDAGYQALAVAGVQEAHQQLSSERYRLILLDLGLEDKSGLHLFRSLQELPHTPQVVVFTGNPSTHLKQRFLEEGALAYIYKGSQAASNDALVETLKSILHSNRYLDYRELSLNEFLRDFVTPESRELFLTHSDANNSERQPKCAQCGATQFRVVFSHKTQLPPFIEGQVVCAECKALLDVELG